LQLEELMQIKFGLLAVGLALSCAPAPRVASPASDQPAAGAPTQETRPLSIVLRIEPFDITDSASSRNNFGRALFIAGLVNLDRDEAPYGVLAAVVPQLNTDSWRLFPDGRMETVFRLRPGLTWHDGTPLTADDFVFARQANTLRMEWGLSVSSISPIEHRTIDEIVAPEPGTVVFRWKQPYIDAAAPEIKPLPRHILGPAIEQGVPEIFGSHPYWTTEHVGAGPYRLASWEPGAYIEGVAFPGYALGKPRIERVRITWSGDPNATLARLLAGDADLAVDQAIQFQQASTLRREWAPRNGGVVILTPSQLRQLQAQHRPAYADPASILDPSLRRATAHALDRQALADAMLEGEGEAAEMTAPRTASYYAEAERIVPKYPYDLRRTEQLMAELGFTRGADGVYTSPTEGRHAPEVLGLAEGQEGQETTIVVDFLKRAGIDAHLRLVPSALINQSDEMKATFPAWRTNYTGANRSLSAERQLGARVASPENRWGGTNKPGWNNPEHDRLYDAWTRALDRDERTRLIIQIMKITSEELPYIPMYFNTEVVAHTSALTGPYSPSIETTSYENVHQWAWR
jgi:peptide/nickel transport system substrate-binding protein